MDFRNTQEQYLTTAAMLQTLYYTEQYTKLSGKSLKFKIQFKVQRSMNHLIRPVYERMLHRQKQRETHASDIQLRKYHHPQALLWATKINRVSFPVTH